VTSSRSCASMAASGSGGGAAALTSDGTSNRLRARTERCDMISSPQDDDPAQHSQPRATAEEPPPTPIAILPPILPRLRDEQAPVDLGLGDRVVLVTGGGRGIGEAVSKTLAAEGAVPVIVGRDEPDNQAVVAAISAAGGRAFAVTAELTRTEECRRAVE